MPVADHQPPALFVNPLRVLREEFLHLVLDRSLKHLLGPAPHQLIQWASPLELLAERQHLRIRNFRK
jgi:hypothetical protein